MRHIGIIVWVIAIGFIVMGDDFIIASIALMVVSAAIGFIIGLIKNKFDEKNGKKSKDNSI